MYRSRQLQRMEFEMFGQSTQNISHLMTVFSTSIGMEIMRSLSLDKTIQTICCLCLT